MAVPDLAPGYLTTVKNLKSQRDENAKQREHERSQALKQFGMSIGKAAFETLADVGVEAFKEKLQRPYELADRGVSEVELPAPDMKKAVMASPLSQYFKGKGPVPEDPFAARSQSPMATQPTVTQPSVAKPAAASAEPAKVDEPKVAEPFMGPPQATKPTAESIKARRIEAARRRVASVEDRAFARGLLKDAEAGDAGALDALEEMPLASAPAEGVARSERRDGEAYRAMGTGGGAIASPGYTPPGYSSAGRDVPVPQTEAEKEAERKAGFKPGGIEVVPAGTPGAVPLPRRDEMGPPRGSGGPLRKLPAPVVIRDESTGEIIYSDTKPPGPPSMAAPPQVPPAAGEPTPLGAGGMRGLFQNLAASRAAGNFRESRDDTLMRRLDQLDPKDRAFVQAAALKRGAIEAATGLDLAQAANLKSKNDPNSPLYKAELAKIQAQNQATQAKLDVFADKVERAKLAKTPGTMEYETLRSKAWEQAALISKRLETRSSGSTSVGSGGGGGGVSISLGGSSSTPLFKVKVVDDGKGWPRVIGPNGEGKYLYQNPDGSVLDYTDKTVKVINIKTGEQEDTGEPVQDIRTGKPPKRADKTGQGAQVPSRPVVRTDTAPAGEPPSALALPPGETSNPYAGMTVEQLRSRETGLAGEIRKNPRDLKGAGEKNTEIGKINDEIKRREEGVKTAEKGDKTRAAWLTGGQKIKNDLIKAANDSRKLESYGVVDGDDFTFNGHDIPLADAKAFLLNGTLPVLSKEEEGDAEAKALHDADVKALTALGAAQLAWERDARKNAFLGLGVLRNNYQGADGTFYQAVEDEFGIRVPEDMRPKSVPPGPSTPSPGQLPPPPGRQSQADPADDLFNKINAMPWSADRKRRVFMAEAQKRGLA